MYIYIYLPSLGAFLGELGEVDRLLGVFLPVFLSTRLDEEGVRRRLPLRLVDVFTHHSGGLEREEEQIMFCTTGQLFTFQYCFIVMMIS